MISTRSARKINQPFLAFRFFCRWTETDSLSRRSKRDQDQHFVNLSFTTEYPDTWKHQKTGPGFGTSDWAERWPPSSTVTRNTTAAAQEWLRDHSERAWAEQPGPKHLWGRLTVTERCWLPGELQPSSSVPEFWLQTSQLSVSSSAQVDGRVTGTKIKRARAGTAPKAERGREHKCHSSSLQENSETEIWF